ncbi:MAG: alpha-glucosidase [Candidatus Lokiarchaeota archaeon]|nr:alpha-glucosidase [Candidatus Lokiarchaeota archaeon]MBD3342143.1 alpha-glucosidase [Candidatus Lokiarchaeota archaeon]
MVENQKIVLVGAGSLQFGLGTVGNIFKSKILEGSTICLHDINAESLELTFKACDAAIEKRKLDFHLESTINRVEALKDASFIINAIEVPPRFELLKLDYRVPQQYGNKQVSGENGGPGGLFHSLRVIPPILDICEDIMKICPHALFINFSNPMSRICLAIKRKFSDLKFVGLCHEYQHFEPYIMRILETPASNLDIKSGGLNHFGVILDIKYKDTGQDAYPELRVKAPDYFYTVNSYDGFKLIAFILETYGYLPYTTDSHYGEYIHWAWRKSDIPAIRKFWSSYENMLNSDLNKLKKLIEKGKGARVVKPDEERAIPIIEGVITDANYVEPSVNIPNKNVFSNLPADLVVECPAIVNKEGLQGLELGEYPKGIAALIRIQAAVQDLTVDAILQKSKELVLQALLADPVIETYWEAKNILEEVLRLEADYIQIDLE